MDDVKWLGSIFLITCPMVVLYLGFDGKARWRSNDGTIDELNTPEFLARLTDTPTEPDPVDPQKHVNEANREEIKHQLNTLLAVLDDGNMLDVLQKWRAESWKQEQSQKAMANTFVLKDGRTVEIMSWDWVPGPFLNVPCLWCLTAEEGMIRIPLDLLEGATTGTH